MAKSFSVFCLYADDVRHEVNGKVSYIGTYMGELNAILPVLPGNLARLAVSAFITVPIERKFNKGNIEVLWDETILQRIDFDSEQSSVFSSSKENADTDNANGHIINALLVIEPMQLSGDGKVLVKVTLDDEVVMGNALKVKAKVPVAQDPLST